MSSALVDPEAPDDSEAQFAASLDGFAPPPPRYQRIVMPEPEPPREEQFTTAVHEQFALAPQPQFSGADDPEIWRQEVASRVESYRAKRRRRGMPTRQPSLHLDFEALEQLEHPYPEAQAVAEPEPEPPPPPLDVRWDGTVVGAGAPEPAPEPAELRAEEASNVIEFPAPAAEYAPAYELAEPVVDGPRILDVPEQVEQGVPTAMADINLEPEIEGELAPADIEVPLQVASLPQRVFGGLVDFIIVLAATAVFGEIVVKICTTIAFSKGMLALALAVPCVFWLSYQYLFLVYAGRTPGMRAARLALIGFESEAVSQHRRRWRALAMVLSCISLGMGFVWAMVDEDTLTWHDRISRTYTAETRGRAIP